MHTERENNPWPIVTVEPERVSLKESPDLAWKASKCHNQMAGKSKKLLRIISVMHKTTCAWLQKGKKKNRNSSEGEHYLPDCDRLGPVVDLRWQSLFFVIVLLPSCDKWQLLNTPSVHCVWNLKCRTKIHRPILAGDNLKRKHAGYIIYQLYIKTSLWAFSSLALIAN